MMKILGPVFLVAALSLSAGLKSQNIQRIEFDQQDSTSGFYLAIPPLSGKIQGTLVLMTSFLPPQAILTETKLHNVAAANDLLTVVVSLKQKIFADEETIDRLNKLFDHVTATFKTGKSSFVLSGYDDAGNIALRYAEMSVEDPNTAKYRPAAVFAIESSVDLAGLYERAAADIRKNFHPGAVGDARFYQDLLQNKLGAPDKNADTYKKYSPFSRPGRAGTQADTSYGMGNEKFLLNMPVRLYYDGDLNWHIRERRNSVYDTRLADGSEMIKQLLLAGAKKAELVLARQPGMRSNGQRHVVSMSVVDEVENIQWIRSVLGIFDARTWKAPYNLPVPTGWEVEHFALPPDFAPGLSVKGVEDVRFMPGWGEPASPEHWSYSFLWWVNGQVSPTEQSLSDDLRLYFTGLVSRNIQGIDPAMVTPTAVQVRKTKTLPGDSASWSGTITMFDYHTKKKMVLNVLVHAKPATVLSKTEDKTALIFALSPQPLNSLVWKKLDKINAGYR